MSLSQWNTAIEAALSARRQAAGFRRRRELRVLDATHIEVDGRSLINFASNDYLGLTHHPRMIAAVISAAQNFGAGSGAAALVSGYSPAHASAERAIAAWKGYESAVMLSSGYAANLAAIQTLVAVAGEKGVRFLIDKLSHASLIDAVLGSGAEYRVFPHNHLSKLKRLLGESEKLNVVVTESIFSMDGDGADLAGLGRLKQKHSFILLLDEAHGSGVFGPGGAGYAAEMGLREIVDISVVTMSKAMGAAGGAVCGSAQFCDALVNFARSYIYSTNIPPAIAAGAETAIGIFRDEPERQKRLREISRRVRAELGLANGDSPIIPIILGDAQLCLDWAAKLEGAGFFVVAIRPPSVSPGGSRLRVTLSSEHTTAEVDALLGALRGIKRPTASEDSVEQAAGDDARHVRQSD